MLWSFLFLSQITKLKIDSNPFAKGFRDSARITQIDRESVDLLIKASRHGYSHLQTSVPNPHCLINIPSAQSQISLFQHGKCYTASVIQINTEINDKQVTHNAYLPHITTVLDLIIAGDNTKNVKLRVFCYYS